MSTSVSPAVVATPTQELLLKAALLPEEQARDAWQRWKQLTGGIERHDHVSYRVLPLLYRRLAAAAPDDPDLQRLKGVYRHTWYLNQRRLHDAASLLGQFERAGIPTLLLKGAALIRHYYVDPGVRPMHDFDVLVPRERYDDAVAALAAAGWRPVEQPAAARRHVPLVQHSLSYVLDDRHLDLHWHALLESTDDAPFWEAAVPLSVGPARTLALSPADQLLHVVVHGTGRGGAPVAWIADAATIVASAGDSLDWSRLADQAAARGLTLRVEGALRYLQERFAVPVDADALARLGQARPGVPERVLHRALTRGRSDAAARYAEYWDRWHRLRRTGGRAPGFLTYVGWTLAMSRPRLLAHLLAGGSRFAIRRMARVRTG